MRRQTHLRYIYPLLLLLLPAIGCEISTNKMVGPGNGGANPNSPTGADPSAIEVTITPTQSALLAGESEQFYAGVMGTGNTAVTWSVEGGPGTITADGLYTAPTAIDADTVRATVRVVVNASTSATATAKIVITKRATTGGGGNNGGNGGGDTLLPGQICFERDILPIFQSSCAMSGCHDVGTAKHGYVFNSYSGIMRGIRPGNPDRSKIHEMIVGKDKDDDDDDKGDDDYDRMPPPPRPALTAGQIGAIREWILQGAKETRCSDNGGNGGGGNNGGGCDTSNVTFSGTVKPILQNNCVGCHSGPTPPRGLNLTSYSGVRTVADNGKLFGAISHAPGFPQMPQGANKLPDCSIAKIKAWINKGAPNN